MPGTRQFDYSRMDRPEISNLIFYPRPEIPGLGYLTDIGSAFGLRSAPKNVLIPVEEGIVVGARFHMAGKSLPNILFFHGSGEIVADYDHLGALYNQAGINFLPVDYRGYGRSTGVPTVTAIMGDCHPIFEFVRKWLTDAEFTGPLVVMGRSMGSAFAIELAVTHSEGIDGLIIESGFAYALPLLSQMGIDVERMGLSNGKGFRNVEKIRRFVKPALIVHAEWDQIIPASEGQILYDACSSSQKELVKIAQANHFDVLLWNLPVYLSAVKAFVERVNKETRTWR